MVSLREEAGIGAGGRTILEGTAAGALVALTRLAKGSVAFGSAGFASAAFGSDSVASGSTGRGRGKGLAGGNSAGRIGANREEIGGGRRPGCRDRAFDT